MIMIWGFLLLCAASPTTAFVPVQHGSRLSPANTRTEFTVLPTIHSPERLSLLKATPSEKEEEKEEEEKKDNPYNDPNYPDLEFVDYSDPEYVVDQGVGDEFFDPDSTEAQIEEMREDRRRRNDEFQFQTYFKELLREGKEFKGEWSVYQTSTFMEEMKDTMDANGLPRLVKSSRPLYVTTKARKSTVECDSEHPTDAERIYFVETVAEKDGEENEISDSKAEEEFNQSILQSGYWPEPLSAFDFRGEKGIMCVGSAYTICTAVSLSGSDNEDATEGPFTQYRAEMGIVSKELRFRIKLDYRMKKDAKDEFVQSSSEDAVAPPLCLKSMVVCRETLERWPPSPDDEYSSASEQVISNAFYGKPGAEGGLYDPPLVGSDDQAGRYMMLDLEGGASLLFPHQMDQDPAAFEGNGWVTSLDWTPGTFRFQVDRKIKGGLGLRNLRTLELSKVQSADADQYRPRDGGEDMRQ